MDWAGFVDLQAKKGQSRASDSFEKCLEDRQRNRTWWITLFSRQTKESRFFSSLCQWCVSVFVCQTAWEREREREREEYEVSECAISREFWWLSPVIIPSLTACPRIVIPPEFVCACACLLVCDCHGEPDGWRLTSRHELKEIIWDTCAYLSINTLQKECRICTPASSTHMHTNTCTRACVACVYISVSGLCQFDPLNVSDGSLTTVRDDLDS